VDGAVGNTQATFLTARHNWNQYHVRVKAMQLALNSVLPTGLIAESSEAMTVFALFTGVTHNVFQSDVRVAQYRPSFLLGRRGD